MSSFDEKWSTLSEAFTEGRQQLVEELRIQRAEKFEQIWELFRDRYGCDVDNLQIVTDALKLPVEVAIRLRALLAAYRKIDEDIEDVWNDAARHLAKNKRRSSSVAR